MVSRWSFGVPVLGQAEVKAAAGRVAARVRPLALIAADPGPFERASLYLACENLQVTGSFAARGAINFALYHQEAGSMPPAGMVLADPGGGDAALACAWAAQETDTRASVFVTEHCGRRMLARLHALRAQVHIVPGGEAALTQAAAAFAEAAAAVLEHPYDALLAAGAGTLAAEIDALVGGEIDTVVVPVGGAGLFAGTCAALAHTGTRIVAVEPEGDQVLASALEPGDAARTAQNPGPGAGSRRVTELALDLARGVDCVPVAVRSEEARHARRTLWEQRRLSVDASAATAMAAIAAGVYVPDLYERVVVILTGGNTDPPRPAQDQAHRPRP